MIRPLADPAAHGGDPDLSFDVVVPSMPGYGFSSPLRRSGHEVSSTAALWRRLMTEVLGYERFATYGGDWGALITAEMAYRFPELFVGMQLGVSISRETRFPPEEEYPEHERERFHHTARRMRGASSHVAVHNADPQTLAYALEDSPVGLCAWLVERRRSWSGCEGDVESVFTKDELLDNVTLYWLTETIGTSMRYYWEFARHPLQPSGDRSPAIAAPTGILLWPQELMLMPTPWMESYYDLRRLTEMPRGGHFHPMEQPQLLVEEISAFHRQLREEG